MRRASSRLFGDPGLVVAGRCRPDPARPKRSVGPECLHRAGQVRRRILLKLADGRESLLRKIVDRPAKPQLPRRRNAAAVVRAAVDHPAPPRTLLVLIVEVTSIVAADLGPEAAGKQRRSPRSPVPPGQCFRPETHGDAPVPQSSTARKGRMISATTPPDHPQQSPTGLPARRAVRARRRPALPPTPASRPAP